MANTKIASDPNNSVIKRLWCTNFRSQEQLQSTGIVWEDADNFNLLPKGMSYFSHTILWKQPFSISPCSGKPPAKYEPRYDKTNVLVSDLVRHKPGCTATEDG